MSEKRLSKAEREEQRAKVGRAAAIGGRWFPAATLLAALDTCDALEKELVGERNKFESWRGLYETATKATVIATQRADALEAERRAFVERAWDHLRLIWGPSVDAELHRGMQVVLAVMESYDDKTVSDAARSWAATECEVVAKLPDEGEWRAGLEVAFDAGRVYEAILRARDAGLDLAACKLPGEEPEKTEGT